MKKSIKTNEDIHIALLQIKSTSLQPELPSPAILLFCCLKYDTKYDTARNYDLFSIGSSVAVQ